MTYGFRADCSQTEICAIAVGQSGVIRISKNNLLGSYVTPQNSPTTSDIARVAVQKSGSDVEVVIVCTDGTIYSVLNPPAPGTTWTWVQNTVSDPGAWYDMIFYSGNYYVVGAGGRIRRRGFNTTTWTTITSGTTQNLWCISNVGGRLAVGATGSATTPTIFKSNAAGDTWSGAGTINPSPNPYAPVGSVAGNGSVYLASSTYYMYYSTDLATWTQVPNGPPSPTTPYTAQSGRVYCSPSDNKLYAALSYATGETYMYVTTTNGVNWTYTYGTPQLSTNTSELAGNPIYFFEDAYFGPVAWTDRGAVAPVLLPFIYKSLAGPTGYFTGGPYMYGLGNAALLYSTSKRNTIMDTSKLVPGLWVNRYVSTPGQTSFTTSFSDVYYPVFAIIRPFNVPFYYYNADIGNGTTCTLTQDTIAGTGTITVNGISSLYQVEITLTTA